MKPIYLLLLTFVLNTVSYTQSRYDVVITEIMADPAPPAGLPDYEWIELKNTSAATIDLRGWHIADASGQSGAMPSFSLKPDSAVIICSSSASVALSAFGNTIPVTSFPSLDNTGELLFLKALNGMTVHAVNYSLSWYQNELKKEGGWSLEMIDTYNPCSGDSNWGASTDPSGGTPGRANSINGPNIDQYPPQLIRSFAKDSNTLILVFNEPLDSLSGANLLSYHIDGGLSLSGAITPGGLFNQVQLSTNVPLIPNKIYTVYVKNITDCEGNPIDINTKTRTGLATDPSSGDIVINEILFNPRQGAYDYIELYNNSSKILDASRLHLANRNSSNIISSMTSLNKQPFSIFPGDYIAITESARVLTLNYLVKDEGLVLDNSALPSYPDDKGTVVLLDQQGVILDEVAYSDKWHFKLLENTEGISLERIDPAAASQDPANWHSAASTDGYGTPGNKNSHSFTAQGLATTIRVLPKVFSPDNDGWEDIATIQYKIDEPGYVANITIFNAAGLIVRSLVQNATMGISGYWNWDGLNDKGKQLPIGIYIIYTQLFNLEGKKQQFKNTVVLARRMY